MIIAIIIYCMLAGTLGAYYLVKTDPRNKNKSITLFDIIGIQLIAQTLIIPLLLLDIFMNTVIDSNNSK